MSQLDKQVTDTAEEDFTAGVTRRRFLAGSASLVVAIGAAGAIKLVPSEAIANENLAATPWVTISADGTITIIYPATEIGQGSSTFLPVILAEELDANWDDVVVHQLDQDDRFFGNRIFGGALYTAGSTAVINYWTQLRTAGAQVKEVLKMSAAKEWGVSAASLTASDSVITDPASGKSMTYGEIAALPGTAEIELPADDAVTLKSKADFKLVGKDVPRRDIPAKSQGAFQFSVDVRVPNMLYASVLRAPVEGETPVSINADAALAIPRVLQTLTLPDGVAVIGETQEAALFGKFALEVEWTETSPARQFDSEKDLARYAEAAADPSVEAATWAESGDANGAISGSAKKISHMYLSDYASHAAFEPMGAVAHVMDGGAKAEVWVGTQSQSLSHYTVRDVLGIENDAITMHMIPVGGSFGRRTELVQPYLRDALLCSKEVGRPVKVLWTREDDMQHGPFRPTAAQHLEAGLDENNMVTGWKHRVATPSVIQYFNPVRWAQVAPKDIISVKGSESGLYEINDKLAEHVIMDRGARLAPWRGIGGAYTSFAAEAFMDEVAIEAGADPLQFRLDLVKDNPRAQYLLNRVGEMADWGTKREDTGLGLSFAGYGKSMAAGIVEIALDRDSGEIKVLNVWSTYDCGIVVSPKNTMAQLEGGIIFGVGSALKERISISGGMVEQSNYYDYEIATINDMPQMYIEIADVDAHPTQVGELSTPFMAGAIANAFYNLTGKRIRHMPFTPDRVLEILEA